MDIFQAIGDLDLDRVNLLLLGDSSLVNSTNVLHGETPLIATAEIGNVAIGQTLINHGADVNADDQDGVTALMLAADRTEVDFVVLLLEQTGLQATRKANINVNAQTKTGQTALMMGVTPEIAELLLDSGADPNIEDVLGETALIRHINHYPTVEVLLQHGANVNAQDSQGKTALRYAVQRFHIESFNLLMSTSNIDVDLPDVDGNTPLMIAARQTYTRLGFLRTLLKDGADPFMKDNIGKTALDYAMEASSAANIDILRTAMAKWQLLNEKATHDLKGKFMVARRLRQGTTTSSGQRLELPQRQLANGIINLAEYDHLCVNLQNKLTKPGVIALAKSLYIPTVGQTKLQLCNQIADKLII